MEPKPGRRREGISISARIRTSVRCAKLGTYVTLWFEADYDTGAVRAQAPDELSEVGWFAEDSLPAPLFAPFERLLAGKILAT